MPTLKTYYAIRVDDSPAVVSVVTAAYYELVKSGGAPLFYGRFRYTRFQSAAGFERLNGLLPFHLSAEGGPISIAESGLSATEVRHLRAHKLILELYRGNGLEPVPPWRQTGLPPADQAALNAAFRQLDPDCQGAADVTTF